MQDKEAVPSHRSAARRRRRRLLGLAVVLVLATILVPPFINIGRYKSRITQAISTSLGRPVRLSSVELRLFPWPSFVLTNLSVAEDPAYGSEPVLHADTVRANLSLWSLWRRDLEFGSIHVENASLNLVHAAPGRWNLDPLFRTAAAHPGSAFRAGRLPYLEATDSRINIKDGAEKLPFSLINTDLSFWQESPGDWRVRLRGQPARTDVALELGDTGIVRLEASLRRAPELRNMPVQLDLDWREAQLGALARLLTGSDTGWRGNLTGEAHVDGTPDAAQVTVRLRATGVHRAEFAPPTPLDFDANCGLIYDYTQRALSKLSCNSPLGDGRLRLTGDIPGAGVPDLTLEMDRIPAAAGLDLLRTMRSGIAPSLEASGTVSGKLQYAAATRSEVVAPVRRRKASKPRSAASPDETLTGRVTVQGFALNGGALSQPLQASRVVLEPTVGGGLGFQQSITGTATMEAGGATPLNVSLRFGTGGYQMTLRGPVSLARGRELAQAAGLVQAGSLDNVTGDAALLNVTAQGPWIQEGEFAAGTQAPVRADGEPEADTLDGTVTLHDADWHADFLAGQVAISEAVLHVNRERLLWDPVQFAYGPVKGTASFSMPVNCAAPGGAAAQPAPDPCAPEFTLHFGSLDAAELQSAFLGARRKGTLLDSLIDRFRSNSAPAWPPLKGSVEAAVLTLGPATIRQASARVKIAAQSAELSDFAGSVLGGRLHGSGTVSWSGDSGNEPSYSVDAGIEGIPATSAGQLLRTHWTGGPLSVNGKVELAGFKARDLAASAKGTVHFSWKHGSMATPASAPEEGPAVSQAKMPAQFEQWSGDVQIGHGAAKLGMNELVSAGHRQELAGGITLTDPPKVQIAPVKPTAH
ncbi:MAG: AsmA family protein [Acidobacteriota bacterium]